MFGIVTRNAEELAWEEFDTTYFEVKGVNGRLTNPVSGSISVIACFGDTARSVAEPDLTPQSKDGDRAIRDNAAFDWGYICPSAESYREDLLEFIAEVVTITPDIRLDEIGFPGDEYCHCERCVRAFEQADERDWNTWRCTQITDFITDIRDIVPGTLSVSLYPDPFPGHLSAQYGVDIEALESVVDEFVIPLYDETYATTYWITILTEGFASRLETPFAVELFASEIDIDALVAVVASIRPMVTSVIFGYDGARARATVRRIRANDNTGETYRAQ